MDTLHKDLEESDGISDSMLIGWHVHPTAELAPLVPGGGTFLVDRGKKC